MRFVIVVCILLFALPAQGQTLCLPRNEIVRTLAERFKEYPNSEGRTNNGATLELFTSKHGRTWTLVLSTGAGLACVVAAGENWGERNNSL